MTYSHRQLGELRRRLIGREVAPAEIGSIAADLDVSIPTALFRRREKASEALLDAIGRPFDRQARDALRRRHVLIYEHVEAPNRRYRRWHPITVSDGKVTRVLRWKRIKAPSRPVMVPATRRALYAGVAAQTKAGNL